MEDILLIDDDVELCSMLSDYLGRHGYHDRGTQRRDGPGALRWAAATPSCCWM